jgi:hypothetical protein
MAEFNYRMLFFDYIDDVSGFYAQPLVVYSRFTEPTKSIGIALSQRATERVAASTGGDRLAKLNTFVNDPTGVAISQNPGLVHQEVQSMVMIRMQLLPLNFDISLFQAFNALRFIEQISYKLGVGRG